MLLTVVTALNRRLQASTSIFLRARSSRYLTSTPSAVDQVDSSIDQRLREDVKSLGKILGASIRTQDPQVFESVEHLRKLGREVHYFVSFFYLVADSILQFYSVA